jgi:hypothetical protein
MRKVKMTVHEKAGRKSGGRKMNEKRLLLLAVSVVIS